MLKKVLILLFVGILSLYSINYVNAGKINFSEKISPNIYSKLEDLSTKLVYLKLEKLNSVYFKIDKILERNKLSEEKKYILLYLKEKVSFSIEKKTTKTPEELKIISDKLDKIDIKTLTKLSNKFNAIEKKYGKTPESRELLNYLKSEIKKKITSKYLENNTKGCLYKGILYEKGKVIDNTTVKKEKYKKWLECSNDYKIVLHYNYFKGEKNDSLSDSNNWDNGNIYEGNKVVDVYEDSNNVDSVSIIKDIPEVFSDDTNTGSIDDTSTGSLEPDDEYDENTSEKCNDEFMELFGEIPSGYVCRNPGDVEGKKVFDTLMNRAQTVCYLTEPKYSFEESIGNGHPVGNKLKIAKVECTKNGRISTESEDDEYTSEKCNDDFMELFGEIPSGYVCRNPGEEKEGIDTLMNRAQTVCYLTEPKYSFDESVSNGHPLGAKLKIAKVECTKNGRIPAEGEEIECEQGEIQVFPISAYEAEGELSEEEELGFCTEEGNITCEKDGKSYIGDSDEETEAFCEFCDGNLDEGDLTDSYENYLCNEGTIFNNTLGEKYKCRAPLGTVNYTIMTDPELSCIDIDNEILQSEGENNTFSEDEKKEQVTNLKTINSTLSFYEKRRGTDFVKNTSGMTTEQKNEERQSLDKSIEEFNRKKTEQEDEMMLFNSYKLDALGAKSIARLGRCPAVSKEVFGNSYGQGKNESYGSNLRCTSAGFFGNTDDSEETEEEITVQAGERDGIDNYFQYLETSACGSDFVMKRKLTGGIIDSMEIEADCKDKDELSYEDDVIKECIEFGATDLLDWVVNIEVNEKAKDACDGPRSAFMRKYCNSDDAKEGKERRETERQNKISDWKKIIKECTTGKDAKIIKECYINNPHPDGQEEFNFKAICGLEYGIYEGSLVESDDFTVTQPTIFLNGEGDTCTASGERCNGDGELLDEDGNVIDGEGDGDGDDEEGDHGGWQEGETYPPLEQNDGVPNLIWDDDIHTDPDGMGTLSLVLQMHKAKDINLLAVGISGTDTDNRKSVAVSAEAHYQGLKGLPIGMNKNKDKMRSGLSASSLNKKYSGSPYKESYTDIDQFPNDGCTNDLNINCGMRKEVVALYKEVLKNADGKVTIATGGSNVNIYELLRSPGGKKLIEEKVDKVVFIYKGQTRDGSIKYYTEAQHYIIDNLPVPFVEAFAFNLNNKYKTYQKIPNSRVGPLFKTYNKRSPTAFVYSRDRYYDGLTKGHSYIDAFGILYGVFGEEMNGKKIATKVGVTFKKTKEDNSIVNTPNGKHFKLIFTEANVDIMYNYIKEILKK